MRANLLSKPYAQELSPERPSGIRGEYNIVRIDGLPYEGETGRFPKLNYRAASSSEIRSSVHGAAMATSDDLAKANIAAAEARTDTKIARLEGKIDLVLSKIDDVREDGRSTRANLWVVGTGLALLIIGVVAAAPIIFDLGMRTREAITKEIQERLPHSPAPPSTQQ